MLGLILADRAELGKAAAAADARAAAEAAGSTPIPEAPLSAAAEAAADGDARFARSLASAAGGGLQTDVHSSDATLLVVPLSLVGQWEDELRTRVAPAAGLRIGRWYGQGRERDPELLATMYDVVITTYATLGRAYNWAEGSARSAAVEAALTEQEERKAARAAMMGLPYKAPQRRCKTQRATLAEVHWRRIVLDESQNINDAKSAASRAAAELISQRRWMLSGTPLSTKIGELLGQIGALQLKSMASTGAWSALFEAPFNGAYAAVPASDSGVVYHKCTRHSSATTPDATVGAMRLLLPRLMLRHTACMTVAGERVMTLPPKTSAVVHVELQPDERRIYLLAEREIQARWREMLAMGEAVVAQSYFLATSMLTPLRRICSGGDIAMKELVARQLPQSANWKMRMGAAPSFEARFSSAACALFAGNHPSGSTCAVCGLEPEGGVRAPCCFSWACRDCLLSAAEEQGVCPNVACGRKLTRARVPQLAAAAAGEGFWADSCPPAAAAAAAVDPAAAARAAHARAARAAAAAADAAECTAAEGEEEEEEEEPEPPLLLESKLKVVLAELANVRKEDAATKTLIFSSFAPSLEWLARRLKENGYTTATITGGMGLAARAKALHAFQTAPPTTIFLLSLRAGAVGLNLTAASHVILLEPCLNPALEEQAIGRVHRLGQTRPTTVKRLIVVNSVEERMLAVVAAHVAGGGAAKLANTGVIEPTVAGGVRRDRAALALAEMSQLFGVAHAVAPRFV
jgi:SNF2 family DNA or RNA helicase